MKYRFQPIPNWDVCSIIREIGFCFSADSAGKAMLENDVFRVTPWRTDTLLHTCNPHKPPQTALISFCTLHPGWAPQHMVCGETVLQWFSLPGGSLMDSCR